MSHRIIVVGTAIVLIPILCGIMEMYGKSAETDALIICGLATAAFITGRLFMHLTKDQMLGGDT